MVFSSVELNSCVHELIIHCTMSYKLLMPKAQFYHLLVLLCWRARIIFCEMTTNQTATTSNTITVTPSPSQSLPAETPTLCILPSSSSEAAMLTSTATLLRSPTPLSPCIVTEDARSDLGGINTIAAIFMGTTVVFCVTSVILATLLVVVCKRMSNIKKNCGRTSSVTSPIGPPGMSHWISRESIPTLEETLSRDKKQNHNIWSLSTRPMTFGNSPDSNTTSEGPENGTDSIPSSTNNNPKKAKIKPKRKAPGPPTPVKPKNNKHGKTDSPAAYIYPVPTAKPPKGEDGPHVYAVPHASHASSPGKRWWLKKSSKKEPTSTEYQGLDKSQIKPPGPYADLTSTMTCTNPIVTQT